MSIKTKQEIGFDVFSNGGQVEVVGTMAGKGFVV